MPSYGVYERAKPRVRVLRGYAGNEPQSLTHSAAIDTDVAQNIKSGQLIVLDASNEWVKATNANSTGKEIYVAYHDETDTDVISSGKLLGFSVLGDFEFQTAYYDAGSYTAGTPISVSAATAGNLRVATNFSKAGEDVIGVVSAEGEVDLTSENSEAALANRTVVQWKSHFKRNLAVA